MADKRRMFTEKITESDAFLEMPLSSQCLYFHMCMYADDDGFVKNPKRIKAMVGASDDDLRVLLAKSFIIGFESGVIVIKHWRIHNILRADRYHPTEYTEEKALLQMKENGAYTLDAEQGVKALPGGVFSEQNGESVPQVETSWQPVGNQMATSCKPDGNQLATDGCHNTIQNNTIQNKLNNSGRFTPPTVEEVRAYCEERKNGIDAEMFVEFYNSKKWYVGKNKMSDWKSAVRTWERRRKTENGAGAGSFDTDEALLAALKKTYGN